MALLYTSCDTSFQKGNDRLLFQLQTHFSFADSLNFFRKTRVYVYMTCPRTTSYCLIQFGFRKTYFCQTALITLTGEIYSAIQTGNLFGLLQLDLSKTFDLVNHTLLFEALKLYHCNADTICWFPVTMRIF